jgi:hypothetical protein
VLRKIVGAFILLALIFVIPILRGESDAKSPGGVLGILAMFAICAGILWGIRSSWTGITRLWLARSTPRQIGPKNDKA